MLFLFYLIFTDNLSLQMDMAVFFNFITLKGDYKIKKNYVEPFPELISPYLL